MKYVCTILFVLGLVLPGMSGTEARGDTPGDRDPVFTDCIVKVKREVEIPAQKEGTLIKLTVDEGSAFEKGEVLAVVDDREAKAAVKVAEKGFKAARQRAEDDIEERYAVAAEEVARVDLEKAIEANRSYLTAFSEIEIKQKELVVKKSSLQIEKAQKDQILAALDADAKKAELEATQVAMEKRTIVAPFAGEVVNKWRNEAEWVNPGDRILTVMQFETLYVETFVKVSEFDRSELLGKRVTVSVPMAHGRQVQLQGEIVHVKQLIESGNNYTVRAEVANIKEGDTWVVPPGGQQAVMTVHMD